MSLWFTSDWHLGHKNVINKDFCDRPYEDIDEMNQALIDNHNSVVKPTDTVYMIGDIVWHKRCLPLLDQVNGKLHLIIGNHDHDFVVEYPRWETVQDYRRIRHEGFRFVLMHFPIECWHKMERGYIHLHGHTHSNTSHKVNILPNRFDVSVDSWNMFPVHVDTIIKGYDPLYENEH